MPRVKTTRIMGQPVQVHTQPISGYYAAPDQGCREIYIDGRQSDSDAFLTVIHEWIHARFPDLSERQVEQIERELGGLCLRLFAVSKKAGAW